MPDFRFSKQYVVYAAPETVFEALTDPGIIAAWGGGLSVVGSEPGGHFELFDGWVKGEITGFVNPKELAFTWKPSEWDKRTKPSTVTIRFSAHPAGTELLIEHAGFPSAEEAEKHDQGWIDHILDPMNDYFIERMA